MTTPRRSRRPRRGRLGATVAVAVAGLMMATSTPASALPLPNGGFEAPQVPEIGFSSFGVGSRLGQCQTALYSGGLERSCWTVTARYVDVVDDGYWQAAAGEQSIELNSGNRAGAVAQAIALAPNQCYYLSFALAANPHGGSGIPLTIVVVQRSAGGTRVTSTTQNYSLESTGRTTATMGYRRRTISFLTSPLTAHGEVRMSGGYTEFAANSAGPVIDDVRLDPCPPLI